MSPQLHRSLLVALMAGAAACGSQPMTPTTASLPPPKIAGLSVSTLVASSSPQTITVSGTNFAAGLTVTISPSIGAVSVAGVTATSFQVTGTFPTPGAYTLTVNVNGQSSNASALTVSAPAPTIGSLSVSSLVGSSSPQTVTVSGTNFAAGLTVTVSPAIGSVTVTNVTPTSFQLTGTFVTPGAYTVTVTVSGQSSNAGALTVSAPAAPPTIAQFDWHSWVPTCGTCAQSGDPINVSCVVATTDGGVVTTNLTLTWPGTPPQATNSTSTPGESALPTGTRTFMNVDVPGPYGSNPTGVAVCTAVNTQGVSASRTITVHSGG